MICSHYSCVLLVLAQFGQYHRSLLSHVVGFIADYLYQRNNQFLEICATLWERADKATNAGACLCERIPLLLLNCQVELIDCGFNYLVEDAYGVLVLVKTNFSKVGVPGQVVQ